MDKSFKWFLAIMLVISLALMGISIATDMGVLDLRR